MSRILVVDDEAMLLQLISRCLEADGHRVFVASGPEEAMEIAERETLPFDLVLTDVHLKLQSGLDFARRLRVRRPDIKILFMSGVADLAGLLAEDFTDSSSIEKPFGVSELRRSVAQKLGVAAA